MVETSQIEYKLKDGRYLNMNLYEIRLENDIIYNIDLLDAFLFECQCALFFVDMSNHKSFDKVKDIISFINNDIYPYLKKIIVENKSDINHEKSNEEIQKYIKENPESNIDYIKISIKTRKNFDNLLNQIFNEVSSYNSEKIIQSVDRVSKCTLKEYPKDPSTRTLSFILIGDSAVGKSNFLSRYIKNSFNLLFISSIAGINNETKTVRIYGKYYYKLIIWDTAGQERFRTIPRSYYRNVDGILLLFDLNDKSSFDSVSEWMSEVKDNLDVSKDQENSVIIYLFGNKIDLVKNGEEKIKRNEIDKLAYDLGIKYFDISCKWNLNIDEVMAKIIIDCYKKNNKKNKAISITKEKLNETRTNQNGNCCA